MYKDFILLIIIISIFCYKYKPDTTKYLKAKNNKKYKVQENENSLKKVEMLSILDTRIRKIVKHMKDNKLPSEKIANRTYSRLEISELREIPKHESGAGYTINKGHIYLCLSKNDKLNNIEDVMFVLLHEVGHTMSESTGHGTEFKNNFDFVVKLAVQLNLWVKKDYSEDHTDICGIEVTNGNCDNGACEKDKLDYYFKSSLLDYN